MKITIDSGSGADDERGLLGRAYIAAVIGPTRRPQGRPRSVTLSATQPVQLATNNLENRVLFCTVAIVSTGGGGIVVFAKDAGSAPGDLVPVGPNTRNFILYPGEVLWGTFQGLANVVVPVTVTTEAF